MLCQPCHPPQAEIWFHKIVSDCGLGPQSEHIVPYKARYCGKYYWYRSNTGLCFVKFMTPDLRLWISVSEPMQKFLTLIRKFPRRVLLAVKTNGFICTINLTWYFNLSHLLLDLAPSVVPNVSTRYSVGCGHRMPSLDYTRCASQRPAFQRSRI